MYTLYMCMYTYIVPVIGNQNCGIILHIHDACTCMCGEQIFITIREQIHKQHFTPHERCVRAVSATAVQILTHAIVQPRLGSLALSICTWTSFDAGSRYGHCIYMRPMPGRRAIKAKGSLHYCTILFIF